MDPSEIDVPAVSNRAHPTRPPYVLDWTEGLARNETKLRIKYDGLRTGIIGMNTIRQLQTYRRGRRAGIRPQYHRRRR